MYLQVGPRHQRTPTLPPPLPVTRMRRLATSPTCLVLLPCPPAVHVCRRSWLQHESSSLRSLAPRRAGMSSQSWPQRRQAAVATGSELLLGSKASAVRGCHRHCLPTLLAVLHLPGPPQDDPTEQVFVFFPEEPKVGVKTIKLLAERMRNEGVQRAIMVTQANMTPFAKQCLSEMAPKYYIELFQEAEMLVNITKHSLVPQHRILTRDEKQTLLDRYKVRRAADVVRGGVLCCSGPSCFVLGAVG